MWVEEHCWLALLIVCYSFLKWISEEKRCQDDDDDDDGVCFGTENQVYGIYHERGGNPERETFTVRSASLLHSIKFCYYTHTTIDIGEQSKQMQVPQEQAEEF